jgi:phosphohistidine phosphatase
MRLYFLRHAEAVDGMDDAARALSARGREQSREVARLRAGGTIAFDAAYSSPLVRARQTAEIVLGVCGTLNPDRLEIVDALLNETNARQFEGWLRGLPDAKHVLLVGHSPSLGARVRSLIGVNDETGLDLPKGGLACVKTADGRQGELKFFVTPRILGV